VRLAHNLIHRICAKPHKSFRLFRDFSTARAGARAALFFSIEKNSFKINALAWSQSACSQSYPHFMCETALAVENCLFAVKSDAENRAFQSLLHFYARQ
jgi:hypothetical protein